MSASLVGSEMCIRDSQNPKNRTPIGTPRRQRRWQRSQSSPPPPPRWGGCLLYTSDAADDMSV
eukprot:5590473-Alexandrium_andersonii.AAC.1